MVNSAFRLSHVDVAYMAKMDGGISQEYQWRQSVTPIDRAGVPSTILEVQEKSIASFPLKMRHADSYISERTALVGYTFTPPLNLSFSLGAAFTMFH